ncbi:flagellin N-terminal helical domain-containing protein [Lawsonibacter sp. JLR.KK007]|uniref:flagellin N-terminal helical domain-containing protein n=1 Tax=Lawsonibacter sp. JLR.KK007 TaxID=3114293 RepID=UPI002FF0A16E
MRIQHNIAAMNAYRNYNLNTSAVTKNLEKLSSGYKINRAGDDAAGLAISEKMRAQISGLEAASKNVKDGISLVKTAEGAMQEVQDMLNRMVTLATQSANGTYDNETDRAALQQEVDQLNSEIDRIADSANFNGIKLLDGSLDANGRRATTTTQINDMVMSSNSFGIAADGTTALKNTEGGLDLTGVNFGSTATELYASDKSIRYHKDAAVGGKTAFTINLDGTTNGNFTAGKSISGLVLGLDGNYTTDASATGATNNALYLKTDGTRVTYDVTADKDGITSQNIAQSIMETIEKNGGKVYLKVGTGTTAGAADEATFIEYNVTLEDGDKLRFEMSDKGYNDAATVAQRNGNTTNYFQGNYNVGLNYKPTVSAPTAGSLEETFTNYVNGETTHPATDNINEGTTPAGTIYAEALIRFQAATPTNTNKNDGYNDITKFFADGAGVKLGDDYYVFAKSDEVFNGEYADNVHVVDIRGLDKLGTTANGAGDDLRKALDRLSVAAKDNEMFDVQVVKGGEALIITERTTYTGDANLTETDNGLEHQIQKFDSVTSNTVVEKEAGNALTLQIGDTSEEFNQLKVNIGDVHATALGVAGLSIADQESAGAAINTIRSAINQVSSIRGTLGATQNRLEHTSNNLSVMTENIQDAESTIRDTDIAEEMMSYTKNNILVQSAQAMLAQANQIPQGVLQLLG